jgi:hypothetical protein
MIDQICIFVFGVGAVYLANDARPQVRRSGCIAGLISQPFWFYTAAVHHQWGILAASFFYTFSWGRGFYYQWVKK